MSKLKAIIVTFTAILALPACNVITSEKSFDASQSIPSSKEEVLALLNNTRRQVLSNNFDTTNVELLHNLDRSNGNMILHLNSTETSDSSYAIELFGMDRKEFTDIRKYFRKLYQSIMLNSYDSTNASSFYETLYKQREQSYNEYQTLRQDLQQKGIKKMKIHPKLTTEHDQSGGYRITGSGKSLNIPFLEMNRIKLLSKIDAISIIVEKYAQ